MLITFFYALFGAVLLLIALFNSGFNIFGKETNRSNATFLVLTYFFGIFFLAAGIFLTVLEKRESIPERKIAAERLAYNQQQQQPEQKGQQKTDLKKEEEEKSSIEPAEAEKQPAPEKQQTFPQTDEEQTVTPPVAKGWAEIRSPEKFVTCKRVTNLVPHFLTKQFASGERVYVWAQIYAPRLEETVRMVWKNDDGEVVANKLMKIRQNLGEGYRIYYWKILQPGNYTISLYNGNGDEIGRREIRVE